MPRLPRSVASPRRSPISRAMVSACSYSSIARCGLAQVGVAVAEVAQVGGFALPVADLPGDGQRLLVELDRALRSGPGRSSSCRGCPGGGFALPVADLPGDGQRLLVELDRPPDLAQVGVAVAEVAQVDGFALPVADLPVDGQGLLVELDGRGVVAQAVVAGAEAGEAGGVGPGVGEVAVEAVVQVDDVAGSGPSDAGSRSRCRAGPGRRCRSRRPGSAARTRPAAGPGRPGSATSRAGFGSGSK